MLVREFLVTENSTGRISFQEVDDIMNIHDIVIWGP